jgi:hypothetical protein
MSNSLKMLVPTNQGLKYITFKNRAEFDEANALWNTHLYDIEKQKWVQRPKVKCRDGTMRIL